MIKIKKLKDINNNELDKLFNRFGHDLSDILQQTVIPIINDVKEHGDSAVNKYNTKFDGIKQDNLLVSEEEIENGYRNADRDILNAFMIAKVNIEEFHIHQKREMIRYSRDDGTELGVMYHAIEKAAVYAPGGKASYPSSVLNGRNTGKNRGMQRNYACNAAGQKRQIYPTLFWQSAEYSE